MSRTTERYVYNDGVPVGRESTAAGCGAPDSIPAAPFVDLRVFDEMGLLSERLLAHFAPERLLARVRPQVHFDVALVQKPAVAYVTVVYRSLPGNVAVGTVYYGISGRRRPAASASSATAFRLAAPVSRFFCGRMRALTRRCGVSELGR